MDKRDAPIKTDDDIYPSVSDLVGKRITAIGMLDQQGFGYNQMVEGGFTIDYVGEDGEVRRLVLGYTELGTWIDWKGVKGKKNPKDLLMEKLCKFFQWDLDDGDDMCIFDYDQQAKKGILSPRLGVEWSDPDQTLRVFRDNDLLISLTRSEIALWSEQMLDETLASQSEDRWYKLFNGLSWWTTWEREDDPLQVEGSE